MPGIQLALDKHWIETRTFWFQLLPPLVLILQPSHNSWSTGWNIAESQIFAAPESYKVLSRLSCSGFPQLIWIFHLFSFGRMNFSPFLFQIKVAWEKLTWTWQIRVSIIKSRLKLGLCATASYFLKYLYFKCVDSAWKIPAGSRWETIILINTNGSWAHILKEEHILWAKPSGWQDGNSETWGRWGKDRRTLHLILCRH